MQLPDMVTQWKTLQKLNTKLTKDSMGNPDLKVKSCGLAISLDSPWLAASPDGLVTDPSEATGPLGVVEIKKKTARSQTLAEVCKNSSFCLENKKDSFDLIMTTFIRYRHSSTCTRKCWCDFVI